MDLSQYTDEELDNLANEHQIDLSGYSDAELDAMAGEQIEQQNSITKAEAVGLGLSGGALPFGNVITSGLAAAATAPFLQQEGEGLREAYSRLYGEAQDYTKDVKEAQPGAYLGGNFLGALSTFPIAFSKAPAAVTGARTAVNAGIIGARDVAAKVAGFSPFQGAGRLSQLGNLTTRMGGGAALASPIAGAYMAGEADSGERSAAFKEGARGGAVVGAALPLAGAGLGLAVGGSKGIAKGVKARGEDVLSSALEKIKEVGRDLYTQVDSSGAMFAKESADELLQSLGGVVKGKDVASSKLFKSTLSAIDDLAEDVAQGNTGLTTLDRHRQILGNIGKDITNPNKAQEAQAANTAIDYIDDFIETAKVASGDENATNLLLDARKVWAQGKKFEKVAKIVNGAGGDANKLKRDFERFRLNPKNTLGWSKDEMLALKNAANQTTGEGVLKAMGKFGFDLGSGRAVGNTALPIIGSVGAGAAGSMGLATAIPVVGTASRSAHKAISAGKAEMLLELIEQGAKVTPKMVNELPPDQKNKFIKGMALMPATQVTASLKSQKVN